MALVLFITLKIYLSESLAKLTLAENKSKIEKALKLGKDINEIDEDFQTALSVAVSTSNEEMLEFLLNNGADVNLQYSEGKTVVDLAFQNKDYNILSKMISAKSIDDNTILMSQNKLLHEAAKNNNYEMVKFLVENGFDVNDVNFESKTPLEIAITNGYEDIKNLLLDKDSKATITENKSITVCESLGGTIIYSKERSITTTKDVEIETFYDHDTISVSIYFGRYKYEGDFKDNSITGNGKLYDSETMSLIYSGGWKNGLFEGKGDLYWPNSSQVFLQGTFNNGNAVQYTRYYQNGSINDTGSVDENGVITSSKFGVYTL